MEKKGEMKTNETIISNLKHANFKPQACYYFAPPFSILNIKR
jgi:hypothetical protein